MFWLIDQKYRKGISRVSSFTTFVERGFASLKILQVLQKEVYLKCGIYIRGQGGFMRGVTRGPNSGVPLQSAQKQFLSMMCVRIMSGEK